MFSRDRGDVLQQEQGWKLFFLHPRMSLSRPCRGGLVPRKKLETRFQKFFAGEWLPLIADRVSVSSHASTARVRKRRRQHFDGRAMRAKKLAVLGELSAARQALECTGVAPGDRNFLSALRGTPTDSAVASLAQATSVQDDTVSACPSPGKTSPQAAQGMESEGCPQRVGADPRQGHWEVSGEGGLKEREGGRERGERGEREGFKTRVLNPPPFQRRV